MPVTVPDTVRCSIIGRWSNGHVMTNVVDYLAEGLGGDFDAGLEVAEACGLAWREFVLPNTLDNYTLEGVQWAVLDTTTGATGFWAPDAAASNVGGGTNQASPPSISVLIRKTGSSGRGTRQGRMYWPPCAESSIDENGFIESTQLASLQLAARRFLAQNTDPALEPTFAMVVTHFDQPRPPSGTEDNRVGTTSLVADLVAQSLVATQRRRLR